MRFYGKNRARMLGVETAEQPDAPEPKRKCKRCHRVLPLKDYDYGRFVTCDGCRARQAAYERSRSK